MSALPVCVPTANPVLDRLRPVFNTWFPAKCGTPFMADLHAQNPALAVRQLCWEALVELGPIFADMTPTVGPHPCPGAISAVAGGSPAAGDRARASLLKAESGKRKAENAGCRMPDGNGGER